MVVSILVGNAPRVLCSLEDTFAIAGKTLKLECDVTLGNPRGEIRWYKDAKELYKSQKYRYKFHTVRVLQRPWSDIFV